MRARTAEESSPTPEGLCTPDYMAQWNAQAQPIAQSLQGQIFYKRHATLVRLTPDRNRAKGLAQQGKKKRKR